MPVGVSGSVNVRVKALEGHMWGKARAWRAGGPALSLWTGLALALAALACALL